MDLNIRHYNKEFSVFPEFFKT